MIFIYLSTVLLAIAMLMIAVQSRRMANQFLKQSSRLKHVEKELKAAAMINQQLGNRLIALESESKKLENQQHELQEFGKNDLFQQRTFKQASQMAQLGASVEELKKSCELSHGEAELLSHLNGGTAEQVAH